MLPDAFNDRGCPTARIPRPDTVAQKLDHLGGKGPALLFREFLDALVELIGNIAYVQGGHVCILG